MPGQICGVVPHEDGPQRRARRIDKHKSTGSRIYSVSPYILRILRVGIDRGFIMLDPEAQG